jgi:hypothetical protein
MAAVTKNRTYGKIAGLYVNDSQNLAFATSHFVIELLPFDYLSNQKQRVNKKMHFKRNNSTHSCRTFSTVGNVF